MSQLEEGNSPLVIDGTASAAPIEIADDARHDIRIGMVAAALFFVLFLGWAAIAPLDAAAFAPGQLVVSGQRQSVQHRDGGLVSAIEVAEGRRVKKGDLLVELAGAEVRAQERALSAQPPVRAGPATRGPIPPPALAFPASAAGR